MSNLRKILLFSGDILIFYFSLFLALIISFWKDFTWKIFLEHFLPFSILYFFWLIIFYIFEIYNLSLFSKVSILYNRILISLVFALFLGITFFYFIPFFGISPKTNLLLIIIIFGVLLLAWRKLFYSLFFSSYFQNKVAFVGNKNPYVEELALTIQKNPYLGYKLITFLNSKDDIFKKIKEEKIDTLILTENFISNPQLVENLYQCFSLKINFIDLAQFFEIICEKIPISFINQIWFLENLKEGKKIFYEKLKRIIDILLSSLILIFTFPLWPFIILAIKLEDKGSLFYKQKRIGKEKKPFFLIKFRSMKEGAEKETGAVWAEEEDSRTTKVGRILRRIHLDEIPQMFNVLKGDISLVGPRPERLEFIQQLEKEIPYYHLRHLIKPGFTGWAQIKFRYARSIIDSYEKFQYDLFYLKNRSLILDFRILLKTFQLFFKKQ